MIVIIHSLYFLVKYCLKFMKRRRCLQEFMTLQSMLEKVNLESCSAVDAEENLSFDPPVYKQRYGAVQQILLDNKWRTEIKKIVDFGCAEFGLFQFIKRLCRIEQILEVDIDEELLKGNLYRIHPLTMDYLNRRTEPLTVQVLSGSISDPDARLLESDVVIGIEIIEHLFPDTLDALPYNIFGYIKPKVAIFTTPNADFNKLFPNFRGFRHDDHKFEWSREQFESWATNIISRFSEYSVSFKGIGKGPKGTEHLGCCSQMAVFIKESRSENIELNIHVEGSIDVISSTCTCKKCVPKTSFGVCSYFSCTEICYECFKSSFTSAPVVDSDVNNYYKVIQIVKYPFEIDERSPEQKILDQLKYRISLLSNINGRFFNDELNRLEIPLTELVLNQYTHFTTVCEAREILEKADYKVEECMVCNELETCVVYEPEMESRSSTPTSGSNDDFNNTDKENWSTITTEGETSDWEVNSDIQRGSWTDTTPSQEIEQTELVGNVYEIVESIITNLELLACDDSESSQNCCEKEENIPDEEEKKCVRKSSSEPVHVMYDSGYYKSNTTLTASTQSGSDLLDGDSLDDHLMNCTNLEEADKVDKIHISPNVINLSSDGCTTSDYEKISTDVKINGQEHKTAVVDVVKQNMSEDFSETYKIINCNTSYISTSNNASNDKVPLTTRSAGGIGNLEMLTVTPNVSMHKTHLLKASVGEATPGTSNVKKKKKIKRFETDDDGTASVIKNEEIEKKIEINEEEDRKNDIIVPEVVEIAPVPEPIVENGDLANNNRDLEGNNYPDAQQNGHQIQNDGNDNENVVLQNNVINNDVAERNEDVENRNADVEEEDGNNDAEIPVANSDYSQAANELEIEFASREALFDPNSEVDLLDDFNQSTSAAGSAANSSDVDESSQNVVIGVSVNSTGSSQVSAVLPISADPFPNWLLHLLGTDIVEEGEPHDEPHFYCQGDGIGVHPSFIEEDFEEDHSSSGSDTSSSGSTNDDAEAEPNMSEIEAVSLPDDTSELGAEQSELPAETVKEAANSENQAIAASAAGTSSGTESADEFFDTLDESLSINNSTSEKTQFSDEVKNKN